MKINGAYMVAIIIIIIIILLKKGSIVTVSSIAIDAIKKREKGL